MKEDYSPETILERALEIDDLQERAAYLDQACGDNGALRGEIESLLGAHGAADTGFMDTLVDPILSEIPGEKEGDSIGRYKLLQQIGEGGFGTVYMAEQIEPVKRKVALKVIKAGMDSKEVIARFEAERQSLAMMDHPNIAKVFDAGATDHGRPYFVMEMVKGIPITEYCDEAVLGTKARLALFGDVCAAINHAHQKGVIHRDIKPSNVMVTLHGDKPVVKVIDFGIAKATQGKLTDQTLFTRFEQFIGTPVYMSPEQAAMSGLDIDTRSDIYALGILLYEMLVGKPPFDSKTLVSAGYEEMRRIIREVEPVKPSSRLVTLMGEERTLLAKAHRIDETKLNKLVEPDLDWIVMKAIDKDRTRRYETANAFAQDIVRYLTDQPVTASPPSKSYQFRKFARRNRSALRIAALIVLLLVAATAVSSWLAVRASKAEQRTAATLEEVAAERDAKDRALKDAEATYRFIDDVFQSPDPTRDGRGITLGETLDWASEKLETQLSDQPERRAKLQSTLGNAYLALGAYKKAVPLLREAYVHYLDEHGPEALETLSTMHQLAASLYDAGRKEEALAMREEVLARRREILGREHPDSLRTQNDLAYSYHKAGRTKEGVSLLEEVLEVRTRILGPEHPETLKTIHRLADLYQRSDRLSESFELFKRTLELRRRVLGPEHPDTLTTMYYLALSHFLLSPPEITKMNWSERMPIAIAKIEEVAKLREKVLGPEHPDTLWPKFYLGGIYEKLGRTEEAIKVREEVLAGRRKALEPNSWELLLSTWALANSYQKAGRLEDAQRIREEAVAISVEAYGINDPGSMNARLLLAENHFATDRKEEALKTREEIVKIRRGVTDSHAGLTPWAMRGLIESYAEAERFDDAVALGDEWLKLGPKSQNPGKRHKAMHILAKCYEKAGRREDAQRLRDEIAGITVPNPAESRAEKTITKDDIPRLSKQSIATPGYTVLAVKVAALQVWFGEEAGYDATCRRMITLAAQTLDPDVAERTAKLACLHAIADAEMRKAALTLARKAVEHGKDEKKKLPWYQTALGMAEYRNGRYREAEAILASVPGIIAHDTYIPEVIEGTAGFYRSMCLVNLNQGEEARKLFRATETMMKPLPFDEEHALIAAHHDDLIVWLAYKEVAALLKIDQLKQNLLMNAGNESLPSEKEAIPGWEMAVGRNWTQRGNNPNAIEGASFFFPGASREAELRQTVSVEAYRNAIEAGRQDFAFAGYVSSYTGGDSARIVVEFLDGTKTEILDSYDSGEHQPGRLWKRLHHQQSAPKGTRFIRVRLIAVRRAGKGNDGYFDDLRLTAEPR